MALWHVLRRCAAHGRSGLVLFPKACGGEPAKRDVVEQTEKGALLEMPCSVPKLNPRTLPRDSKLERRRAL